MRRNHYATPLVEVTGNWANDAAKAGIQIVQFSGKTSAAVAGGKPQPIQVRGQSGLIDRGPEINPNLVALSWDEAGRTYHAVAILGESFTLDEFLAVVESLS